MIFIIYIYLRVLRRLSIELCFPPHVSWNGYVSTCWSSYSGIYPYQLTINPVFHEQIKHFNIYYHVVLNKYKTGYVNHLHLPSNKQFADLLSPYLLLLFTSILQVRPYLLKSYLKGLWIYGYVKNIYGRMELHRQRSVENWPWRKYTRIPIAIRNSQGEY